jgi:integrase
LDSYSQKLLSEQDRKWKGGFNLDAFIFTSHPLGLEPWKPNWVTQTFIRARRTAGLDHFRLHDLRHFMATQMLSAGVAIPVVSARLAHARASTTLNVYAHAIPGADMQAAELISGIVSPSARARLFVTNQRSGDALVSDRVV